MFGVPHVDNCTQVSFPTKVATVSKQYIGVPIRRLSVDICHRDASLIRPNEPFDHDGYGAEGKRGVGLYQSMEVRFESNRERGRGEGRE